MSGHERMALFLDVDGTLLDIQDHPDAVASDVMLRTLLERVAQHLGGALALVSGRPLVEIDRIFAPAVFAAAGGHGVEIRLPGSPARTLAPAVFPAHVRETLEAAVTAWPGTFVEAKSHGVALHYRANPAARDALADLAVGAVSELDGDFTLLKGKMVLELVPKSINKGGAVRHLMNEAPFAGRRPVFVGDDVTDEAGFAAALALGGQAYRVGDAVEGTAAPASLADVKAVHGWLHQLIEERP